MSHQKITAIAAMTIIVQINAFTPCVLREEDQAI